MDPLSPEQVDSFRRALQKGDGLDFLGKLPGLDCMVIGAFIATIDAEKAKADGFKLQRDVLALNYDNESSPVVVIKNSKGDIVGITWNQALASATSPLELPSYYVSE